MPIVTPVGYRLINETTAGLERIAGAVPAVCGDVRWSVFCKRLRRARSDDGATARFAGSDDPAHWNYWLREYEAYGSLLLSELAGGLRAPACFARELRDDTATLWLQDVRGVPASRWDVARFALAMRHLGRFHGRFAAGEPLPAYRWLSRGHLRAWTPSDELDDDADPRVARLHARREELLAAVEATPRTVSHLDLRAANLFGGRLPDADDATVVVDWSSVGIGALGEDVANAVLDSVWMCDLDGALLEPLSAAAVDGYVAGLVDAGWRGDDRAVRWNYAAVAALRFGLLAPRTRRAVHDEAYLSTLEARYGVPAPTVVARRAAVCELALRLSEEGCR